MGYDPKKIESKWQKYWQDNSSYKCKIDKSKPKYYILDMFPYPSGAGLHVGHPLGYIASDILARHKRMQGFNVLHPMGYDAFGLPAEQYAIQTGQHPAKTTAINIERYRSQLDKIGFSFDWSREVRTCDPKYYKWTQWAFIQMFEHWYNQETNKAEPIESVISEFEVNGNLKLKAAHDCKINFSSKEWNNFDRVKKSEILLCYRLAYQADLNVNWCAALGTVLANDEVKEGYSVRGNHPVEQRLMRQWCLRISAYAQRLLDGLDTVDWTESIKEIQRNWIGRSVGAEIDFQIKNHDLKLKIFTTRPDTIFGSSFMVIAPEHELCDKITTPDQKNAVQNYIENTKKRSERERLADTKTISGVHTGAYAIHPFTNEQIPIWISDYVLINYGTGAIMAVPAHDQRDFDFAKHFKLKITEVVSGGDISEQAYETKNGPLINSDFLNNLSVDEAVQSCIKKIIELGIGKQKINYRLRDAAFSRQRYWGEPIPIFYDKDGIATPLPLESLPLELPEVDKYLPTESGEPPLARAKSWKTVDGNPLETNTMPGFAGSSAYFLRYMDPHNEESLVNDDAANYWKNVDLYIGGNEHATGHLIYSRFWNMFLYDIDIAKTEEPFAKMINQGMIQGRSSLVYRLKDKKNTFVSAGLKNKYSCVAIHVDIELAKDDKLDLEAFKNWRPDLKDAEFILEDGVFHCDYAVEKMSKSLYNVVNPDDVVTKYGADTLRLYEMFLGPLEQSKPWSTHGIEGVYRFLNKLWRLFFDDNDNPLINQEDPTPEELKILHTLLKKIDYDMTHISLNTSVSAFMICVNDLSKIDCHKRAILEPLLLCLAPFTPHICEELWSSVLGYKTSITSASFPNFDEQYLSESHFEYPVSINGKMRFHLKMPIDSTKEEIEKIVIAHPNTLKYIDSKPIKKLIIVPNKIINIVI